MPIISRVIDECTVKLSDTWTWNGLAGTEVRIAGLMPTGQPDETTGLIATMRQLVGNRIEIVTPFFVETGPVLVAEMVIPGVDFRTFFRDRFIGPPPCDRMFDPEDYREIRQVCGLISQQWSNPVSHVVPVKDHPFLTNPTYPTDNWVPGFMDVRNTLLRHFSLSREKSSLMLKLEETLSSRRQSTNVLFGECGSGKSWFIREYFAAHPPADADVGFIDVSTLRPLNNRHTPQEDVRF